MLILTVGLAMASGVLGQGVDPSFRPVLTDTKLSTERVRPGDRFAIEFWFRNEGTAAAKREYTIFLHFEQPDRDCRNIRFSGHYHPSPATVRWQAGEVAHAGPYAVQAPAEASGEYHIHIGIFDEGGTGQRLCEEYRGTLTVDPKAPPHNPRQEPLSAEQANAGRAAVAKRLRDPVKLDCGSFEFRLDGSTGSWEIADKRSAELWGSSPYVEGLGEIALANGDKTAALPLGKPDDLQAEDRALTLTYRLQPGEGDPVEARVRLERVEGPDGLRVSYEAAPQGDWHATGATLLQDALTVTNNEGGYLAVPHRLGILLRADGGLPETRDFRAYGNAGAYSMAFVGAVKNGSAILAAWDDPYTILQTRGNWVDNPLVPGSHALSVSLRQTNSARSFTLYPLGKGGYVQVAQAYREVAKQRGLLRRWADKGGQATAMFGAADFKPFVFSRTVAHTRWNDSDEDRVSVGYTFDEAAQVAEHFRKDLGIDRAMYVLAGWIHRGYDNQHPDILPAAPECGGDEDLANCAARVKACGYAFGLHDNYQDMYKDAPSWDESFVMKHRDGSLFAGGVWAGGQAYLTCSRKALELARRPQNLNEVRRLFHPTIYFIDTTFAAPPFECFDPAHPLTLNDDIRWKGELVRYARSLFGLFGSEEGQEWAAPDADYFEGIMSQKAEDDGQDVVPLFEIVYGDCVNLYTHQGDRANASRPTYILGHILYAENAVYEFGSHLYFQAAQPTGVPVKPEVASLKQTGPRTFDITYRWRVSGAVGKYPRVFVHFTSPAATRLEQIAFQNDHVLPKPSATWQPGETVEVGPLSVEIPEGQQGTFAVMIGLLDEGGGRQALQGLRGANGRYHIGNVTLDNDKITFEAVDPSGAQPERCFARADNGWAQDLNETDRFIKNTYQVLSPLNRLTANTPMTDHEFVSADPRVERSRFGDDVEIVANYGPGVHKEGSVELPQYGFLVRSPTLWAFHATRFGGVTYSPSAMFVVEALDDKPITNSAKVRIYHAFGDAKISIGGKTFEVAREAEVNVRG
ncbi:MAG: hypothetical protein FJX75_22995 [Armatimonadetes bacterium]|nr:hypothetical protein [Armatimonadota bacterium]